MRLFDGFRAACLRAAEELGPAAALINRADRLMMGDMMLL